VQFGPVHLLEIAAEGFLFIFEFLVGAEFVCLTGFLVGGVGRGFAKQVIGSAAAGFGGSAVAQCDCAQGFEGFETNGAAEEAGAEAEDGFRVFVNLFEVCVVREDVGDLGTSELGEKLDGGEGLRGVEQVVELFDCDGFEGEERFSGTRNLSYL